MRQGAGQIILCIIIIIIYLFFRYSNSRWKLNNWEINLNFDQIDMILEFKLY